MDLGALTASSLIRQATSIRKAGVLHDGLLKIIVRLLPICSVARIIISLIRKVLYEMIIFHMLDQFYTSSTLETESELR